jgi:anion-transporting  ArsA/GET3 family ATPase
MTPLSSRRFLFLTGKGGVGKTTVAAALAQTLAQRGKRVLLTMTEAHERVSAMLGGAPIKTEISELSPNLSAVLLASDVALREYGSMVLKSKKLVEAVFDNKYVQGFLNGAPGLKEWSLLGKAWFHATEQVNGRPRFDVILFDAPATGHGLEMLRVPKVIVEIAPPGVLRNDAQKAWDMFQNPAESGVIVVTLPEDMPTNETFELCAAIRQELELPLASIVANAVLPALFAPSERDTLIALRPFAVSQAGDVAIDSGVRRALRERIQASSLERLKTLGAPLFTLPFLARGTHQPEAFKILTQHLFHSAL